MKNILIIAGEASSDMHAANLVKDILSLDGNISFFGLGGEKMRGAGVNLLENIVHLAFIGPGGLFRHYAALKKIYNRLCNYIRTNPPDCAILIDYAEFNLRVARVLKKLNVPVIYYISPQVWAWGPWRIKTIKKLVDKIVVFFKFEEKLYKEHGIDVKCVGHPLLDIVKPKEDKEAFKNRLGLDKSKKIVGILPGSREAEIKNILPIMLSAAELIIGRFKDVEFLLPLAATIDESYVKKFIDKSLLKIRIVKNATYDVVSVCDCAMVTSGTATLETAILGVPMAIIYKTNLLTYLITRSVIKLPYIGIVNVIAGKKIVPEFLQYRARPEKISDYIIRLLTDKNLNASVKGRLSEVKKSLGEHGAVARAALEIAGFLHRV